MNIETKAGHSAERAAKVYRALTFIEGGCTLEQAAERNGVSVDMVTAAALTVLQIRKLIAAGLAFSEISSQCDVPLASVLVEAKRLAAKGQEAAISARDGDAQKCASTRSQ